MNEPTAAAREALAAIIRQHVGRLAEHFDCVQILASNVEETTGDTISFDLGAGNMHARLNHAREWILSNDELVKERMRGE